ncbi:hypothetical protein LOC54_04605 [Acetobacter sp. AN02]|uniref:hypothetical protein n=1 Tax=Acetobacter sp. AN02 TaxID=2894186 RepID=UPI0024344F75|nr:hypothetical protein [Acetobacter sp. AN02]MDG6094399.1 hypothetical protein [Acetobacter sp. AN02]
MLLSSFPGRLALAVTTGYVLSLALLQGILLLSSGARHDAEFPALLSCITFLPAAVLLIFCARSLSAGLIRAGFAALAALLLPVLFSYVAVR